MMQPRVCKEAVLYTSLLILQVNAGITLTRADTSENSVLPNPTKLGIQNPNYALNEDKIHNNDETKNYNTLTSLPSYMKYLKSFCSGSHGCGNNVRTESLNSRFKPWPEDLLVRFTKDQQPSTLHTKDEDIGKRSAMQKALLNLFRQQIPAYRRATSDQVVASQVKRDGTSQKNTPKSDPGIFSGEKSLPNKDMRMVKSLYFDLLKRSTKPEKTNHEKFPKISNGRFSNSDDDLGMVKELYFNLLKRGGNWKMTKSDNDKKQMEQISSKDLELLKELFFKLMKRNADPNMTTPSNKAITKIQNSDINDNIGHPKELFFNLGINPMKRGNNLRETRANRQKSSDQELRKKLGLVKELFFGLMKRNTKTVTPGKNEAQKFPNFKLNNNLGQVKSLYFDLLKRNGDKKMTKLGQRTPLGKSLDFQKNVGMVKDLYFDLFKRGGPISSTKKNDVGHDVVNIPYMSHPHLNNHINDDFVKSLYFDLFN